MWIAFREFTLFTHVWRHVNGLEPLDLEDKPDHSDISTIRHDDWYGSHFGPEDLFTGVGIRMGYQQRNQCQVEIPPSYMRTTDSSRLVHHSNRYRDWYSRSTDTQVKEEHSAVGPRDMNNCVHCVHNHVSSEECWEEVMFNTMYMRRPPPRGLFSSDEEDDDATEDHREIASGVSSALRMCQVRSPSSPLKRQRSESSESSH